ncbi:proline--tRNA ligase [Lentisphaera profundi]|uniref:Proline--tRNA ligase n=1 Tax=Lentisphaera profundi TaxID=1658616 RepID=A0ABY7VXY1_9BACT|nr:proline--tRNA ligase [Lentisphaera profundi]WDE96928.1 proline--tRNA ligase [Lentisphaera profundi]
MRLSKLIGKRVKEAPKDAQSASHIFLMRGGYIRPLSTGIFTLLPLAARMTAKIENIIREEMNAVESQEILMPLVNPADIWHESGRYDSVDQSLLRFKDRNQKDMVLAMTHEEAVCHMARTEITSYKQLPTSVFQIQTKYRDEARARAGLIRVREFTMKDAYSFHETEECLSSYYNEVHKAYERIFQRLGLTDCVSIEADSGMIGGSLSHEFMAVTEIGEDTIFLSPDRQYKANREVATSKITYKSEAALELEKVHTPTQKTIEEVSLFLEVAESDTAKAVFYSSASIEDKVILCVIRGDIEVNETKLGNHLGCGDLVTANDEAIIAAGAVPGFASPKGLNKDNVIIIADPSAVESSNLVVGANEEAHHYKNFNWERDFDGDADIIDIATVREGEPCPITGEPLEMLNGIEVGNIFQLGTKYSDSMGVRYLDKNGKSQIPTMGCYGIGVGRALASVCEQRNDKWGPVWPISIAPYQVHLIALTGGQAPIKEEAEELYKKLQKEGIEVIFDDRSPKPGFAFNDADLIGVPLRLIISKKSLEQDAYEFKTRDGSEKELIPKADVFDFIVNRVKTEMEKFV